LRPVHGGLLAAAGVFTAMYFLAAFATAVPPHVLPLLAFVFCVCGFLVGIVVIDILEDRARCRG